jgi:hypothetical protein
MRDLICLIVLFTQGATQRWYRRPISPLTDHVMNGRKDPEALNFALSKKREARCLQSSQRRSHLHHHGILTTFILTGSGESQKLPNVGIRHLARHGRSERSNRPLWIISTTQWNIIINKVRKSIKGRARKGEGADQVRHLATIEACGRDK